MTFYFILSEVIERKSFKKVTTVETVIAEKVNKAQPSETKASKPKSDKKTAVLASRLEEKMSKISNSKELLEFLDSESKMRKTDRKSAVTRKVDQSQWKEMRNEFKAILSGHVKAKQIRKMKQRLVSWILNPDSKGQNKK